MGSRPAPKCCTWTHVGHTSTLPHRCAKLLALTWPSIRSLRASWSLLFFLKLTNDECECELVARRLHNLRTHDVCRPMVSRPAPNARHRRYVAKLGARVGRASRTNVAMTFAPLGFVCVRSVPS